ncbi:sulfite reductase (ferredoxin) [Propionibacterium cyclohexanicum]|uniref:assimilatory sulfite reductase (ferredoxin) n=1 Tax=Propionibacterium cyclohexanicum TaxID=64702 RepID=A0A1H9SLV6_9ACTN|nr:nitrite/sulfite reductase [Propionibacterium cyclohexanicum]SER85976.1 sulfite reductase (ferredoxin) [Propionibacterium cyclohexanicum]
MTSTSHRRSEGQWAVDGHAPLNSNEVVKAEENGLHVRQRVINDYAARGFRSIPPDDLNGRLRWWGIYTQRRQGVPGGRTGSVSPEDLNDSHFMMRVRIDGLGLTVRQLRVLGDISTKFARGTADITDRQNLQFHWIEIESVPEIWRRLEAVGLSTVHACGDTPRGFLCSPVAGVAADEIIDPRPVIRQIKQRYIGREEISNLPRKFKTAITGSPTLDVLHEINDISLVGVRHPELGPGYDLWVAGALSVTPRLGERLGAFVTEEQAPDVWYAVIRLFREYGYRRLRSKARLKFLLADWGPQRFRQVLEDEFLGYRLPDGPAPAQPTGPSDHIGVHEQKDGRRYVGFAPTVGRLSGALLADIATAAQAAGSDRVAFTPQQKVIVLDVGETKVARLLATMERLGLTANPSPFRRSTLACTGLEFCKFAFVETKGLAARTIFELDRRLADVQLPAPISLNINGCPNSCARIQLADIGLKGQLQQNAEGTQEFIFQVHLGGGLESAQRGQAGLGRTLRGLKIGVAELPDYVERVSRRFVAEREPDESFAKWVQRAPEESLR